MNEKIYTVILPSITVENLKLNGNNFISENKLSKEMFNNLSEVRITNGDTEEIHTNMSLVRLYDYENGSAFILKDMSNEEIAQIKMKSDIDYLAMMCDVEL